MRSNSISSISSASSAWGCEDSVQIFVKNIAGESESSSSRVPCPGPDANAVAAFPLTVPSDTSIDTLKSLLALRTNLPPTDLRLVHAGKHLTSADSTLTDYNITRDSTLHLALPVRGGMPPKKIRCSYKDCRDAAQRIVGDCGFCSGHFCGRHRLLEDHKCEGLEDCKKESHERNADKLNSERTVAIRGI